MPKTYIVDKDYQNSRFDKWFKAKIINLPQSLIEKIIRLNKVKINKKKTTSSYRVKFGDVVEVFNISNFKVIERPKTLKYAPSKKEINLYDDYIIENNQNFVVINKPAGIPVQSGTKSFKNIIDILKNSKYFKDQKPYIVHRIDKETSGVLIVAKNREYAQLFTSLFRLRKIHKTYIAIAHGKVSKNKNILKDELIFYEKNRKISQKEISYLKVLKISEDYSYIELNPVTGRKHQLRKQLYNIQHPIVGDDKYFINRRINKKINYKKNLMLHSYKIKFMINNIKYNFKAKYNKIFEDFLKKNFKLN